MKISLNQLRKIIKEELELQQASVLESECDECSMGEVEEEPAEDLEEGEFDMVEWMNANNEASIPDPQRQTAGRKKPLQKHWDRRPQDEVEESEELSEIEEE